MFCRWQKIARGPLKCEDRADHTPRIREPVGLAVGGDRPSPARQLDIVSATLKGLSNGANPGEQRGECPCTSILEGAGNASWDFSVKSVPAKGNRVAGGMLREYYVDERMLAWDKGLDRPSETDDRFRSTPWSDLPSAAQLGQQVAGHARVVARVQVHRDPVGQMEAEALKGSPRWA